MRKRAFAFYLAVVMLLGTTGVASAVEARASHNLDDYSVALTAEGGGVMSITAVVNGVGEQDKIGVQQINIEYKTSLNGDWEYYDSLYAAEYPELYAYGNRTFMGGVDFNGEVGHYYRVTITAYAKKGTLSDTGYVTSTGVRCK